MERADDSWDVAVKRLRAAGCVAPEDEATELVRLARDRATLDAWLARREQGEPVEWITGQVEFCGRTIRVDPEVYVPRPQSQELVYRAAGLLGTGAAGAAAGAVADLCTGTGAVARALMAECPRASVVGVENDSRAASCARKNGVPVVVGDLAEPLAPRSLDLITAVAPYVPTGHLPYLPRDVTRYEPLTALDGGTEGLSVVRRIVESAPRVLRPGGWLVVELGHDQDTLLAPTLHSTGFGMWSAWTDEEGDLRGLAARLT